MLRLVRPLNLLFIALTQLLFQYCVISPLFDALGYPTTLNGFEFATLVISTVLVAAAGYVLNDYEDIEIDNINKPDRVIVGQSVSRITAFRLYLGLAFGGILLGFLAAWFAGNLMLGFFHLAISGLLWFYSTGYKKQLIIGNVVIAALAAMVVLIVVAFEPLLYQGFPIFGDEERFFAKLIIAYALGFAVFAFLLTLLREITKDIEDLEGDISYYCNTIPVVLGIGWTKVVIACLTLVTLFLIFLFQRQQYSLEMDSTVWYFLLLVQLPLIAYVILVGRAKELKSFRFPSSLLKLIMLSGVLYLLLFRTTITVSEQSSEPTITIEEE